MCMIVDANVLGRFLLQPKHGDIAPIYHWLEQGWGSIVYSTGGQFKRDIDFRSQRRLHRLVQAGLARSVPWKKIQGHTESLGPIHSNDEHILALAIVSRVRLLYTDDVALRRDFKDRSIVGGAIYRNHSDAHLLTKDACARAQS